MDENARNKVDGLLGAALIAHRAALLRYFIARRVPPDEAEDILQDLVVKLASHASGPVAEPRAYLYRMAENLLLDRIRSEGRRRGREQAWVAAQSGAALDADDRPSAEQALIARERLALISAALAALPERTAFVFRRYRIDGAPQRADRGRAGHQPERGREAFAAGLSCRDRGAGAPGCG